MKIRTEEIILLKKEFEILPYPTSFLHSYLVMVN